MAIVDELTQFNLGLNLVKENFADLLDDFSIPHNQYIWTSETGTYGSDWRYWVSLHDGRVNQGHSNLEKAYAVCTYDGIYKSGRRNINYIDQ